MKRVFAAATVCGVLSCADALWAQAQPLVRSTPAAGAFPLAAGGKVADLVVDPADYKVVRIAADLFAGDVEKVTGARPQVLQAAAGGGGPRVYIGTRGHSPTVDALVKAKNVDTASIDGKWESYVIVPVDRPAPGVDAGLLVVGSDRRGTAFGVLTLSEQMGVSPWTWWADVPPARRDAVYVGGGPHVQGPPSVKYRGLFINDEDWGLQPWAAKTFEPKAAGGVGDIGPKTYAKVFELLLRLKANFCWPAMHDCTEAFNLYPENKQVADDYAIVMGSSHCEPMLRNNVSEWRDAQGRVGQAAGASFNYLTNKDGVLNYWKQRVQENGKFENAYTLGMRGIHDSDMAGGGTPDERAKRLSGIMADQRQLIHDLVNPDVAKVPQIFCPYKEVLTLYQRGAVPPDDVTLVWADDNHGYIRQLATPAEQQRSGGFGVYYHISYWGRPHDYLWLCTTPPALVWEELSKAYDYGSRNLWVINVGDIKPSEIDLTLAMTMAYDAKRYTVDNIGDYLKDFATETFGPEHAAETANLLAHHYQLAYQRKPEHMGFNTSQNPGGPIQPTEFSDEEIQTRLAQYDALAAAVDTLYGRIPAAQKDAFYQLVVYPIRGAALQNRKLLLADVNRRATAKGDAEAARTAAAAAKAAYDAIQRETAYFNDTLAGGKWKFMMSPIPHATDVFRLPQNVASATAAADAYRPTPARPVSLADKPAPAGEGHAYAERGGYVSIGAEHFTRKLERGGATWKEIPGLGRIGSSVAAFPTTFPSTADAGDAAAKAPALEYDYTTTTAADRATVTVQAIPTRRINPERGLRYAVAVDNGPPQVVDLETPENSAAWSANVLRGSALGTTTHAIAPGKHTLHVYLMDPGVVLDHLTIDLGGLPKSYLAPAETPAGG
jgi:hypothetical protein